MNHYTLLPVSGTIDWSKIPCTKVEHQLWGTDVDIAMAAQLCYSDAGLHVHLLAKETHIRAEEASPYGMSCLDSCMEFFFCPEEGDSRYFNIEIGAGGCVYLGVGHDRYDSVRLIPHGDNAMKDLQINKTPDGWEVYFTFSAEFIRIFFPDFRLFPGKKLRANLYKCGDLTVQEHYIAWNFVGSETPDYHLPQWFGEMELG